MVLSDEKKREYMKRLLMSRMRLLINNGFYGLLLMHMVYSIDENCETAATDGKRIIFGPGFLEELSDPELDFVMMHQILHVVLQHCLRRGDRDQDKFDMACDIVVNSNILLSNNMNLNSITLRKYGEAVHVAPDGKEGYEYTAEQVYGMLPVPAGLKSQSKEKPEPASTERAEKDQGKKDEKGKEKGKGKDKNEDEDEGEKGGGCKKAGKGSSKGKGDGDGRGEGNEEGEGERGGGTEGISKENARSNGKSEARGEGAGNGNGKSDEEGEGDSGRTGKGSSKGKGDRRGESESEDDGGGSEGTDRGSGKGEEPNDGNNEKGNVLGRAQKKQGKRTDTSAGWDDHTRWGMYEDDDTVRDVWVKRFENACEAISIRDPGNQRGILPLWAERLLQELRKPQTDWRTILNEFVQEEVVDYSFTPPDRRFDDNPFFLPDFNDKDNIVEDILFMIDTSGSMSDDMITAAYSEVKGAIDQFDGKLKGWLGFFDAAIIEPVPFSSLDEFMIIKPAGGGGTDFQIIFEYVQKHMQDKLPASIIILTDGFAPFPKEHLSMGIPVLWLLNNEKVDPPWGKTARIMM